MQEEQEQIIRDPNIAAIINNALSTFEEDVETEDEETEMDMSKITSELGEFDDEESSVEFDDDEESENLDDMFGDL